MNALAPHREFVGTGLYTPAEAARLVGVSAPRLRRWLRGHSVGETTYAPLWSSQVDIGDGTLYLGFLDLLQAKAAGSFIRWGLSPQRVRLVIERARGVLDESHPLAVSRFRTDGRAIFLEVVREDGDPRLIDLASNQWSMRDILEPLLRQVEFGSGGRARRWWPADRRGGVFVDPDHAFGQPVEAETFVPTVVLAAAAEAEGSVEAAARAWSVSPTAVERAVTFEAGLGSALAA